METNLPVDVLSWVIALFPLALILVLLVWLRWSAPEAGPIGFLVAVLTSVLIFRTPVETIVNATGRGIWDAIFILYVVWPALLLYQVTRHSGAFEAMRIQIEEHSRNRLFLVLALGWVFASFLQGITGFGAPIAIVAPLLIGLGVTPVMAVVIPLIGHAWGNAFGTLAVAWFALTLVVDLRNPALTALYATLMVWISNALAGFTIAWLFGRWHAVREAFWAIIVITLIHGGGQAILSQVDPSLANFIPTTIALGSIFVLSRWSKYRERSVEESPIMEEREIEDEKPNMGLHEAFLPYYVLIVVTVGTLAVPAIRGFLEQWEIGLPFPSAETGYGVETEAAEPYSPFAVLTHPGTYLLLVSILAYLWFKARGHYGDRAVSRITCGMIANAVPASVAVVGFLVMSKVLDLSGQVTVLALGIAAVSPPAVYAGLANFIGLIGAFMTSSNTASNILLGPLQQQTATAVPALSEAQIMASQHAGSAVGNAVAPANAVLGTGTAGITGKEGEVIKYTLVYSLAAGILIGILAVILYFSA